MNKKKTPIIATAVAVALMSSTGYCAFGGAGPGGPLPVTSAPPAVRLLPEAVIPYPLENPE